MQPSDCDKEGQPEMAGHTGLQYYSNNYDYSFFFDGGIVSLHCSSGSTSFDGYLLKNRVQLDINQKRAATLVHSLRPKRVTTFADVRAFERVGVCSNPGHNAAGQNAIPENATRTKCHPGSERPDKMPLSYFA